jgi:phosphoribosyl-ATP pyrophosphohydrolase/phosphoribosyl-AMP cyclohydrolase/histidinol dehydrogenase
VAKLETILNDRKKSAPAGSYTKRLFDDPDLLRKKLLEEVQVQVQTH